MGTNALLLLILLCILVFCIPGNGVYAFGAGNIPSFAYMEGLAFRHGDIEDTLSEVAKKAGGFALGAIIGKGGTKFGGLDIKRVYFGNWLRDYSQAVDVAGLSKLPLQTIINLCMVLGFLANGYATHEFEVTEDRLGVYLPTEHIDNPKGYPEDAQKYHPKLRPPVNPQELEIDARSGMKNYIANEHGSWDTSKALVRRTLERCIHLGRQHRAQGRKEDEYEAYRLLGQALHTLEDFAAHSNFCELMLVHLGHQNVFLHVGDQVRIQAPNGKWVAPIVTGTFGSQDFIHSLLGEATDHISQASVSDLNKELDKARAKAGPTNRDGGSSAADTLRNLLFSIPGGGGSEMAREMDNIQRIRAGPAQGGKPPDQMSPQELHAVLWQVLTFRDSVVKKIEKTIERIPGLGALIEKLMDGISVFVFTTLEPFIKPLMKTATAQLMAASGEVINQQDQYEVFNDPRASDPTHSFLSKDHFNLILNEPAGNLGKIVLKYTAGWVVKAWDDSSINVHQVTEDILSALFHPDFHDSSSKIQREMMGYMQSWVQSLGNRQQEILNRLSKESVRAHKNIRLAGSGGQSAAQGTYAQNAGLQAQHDVQNYVSGIPVVGSAAGFIGKLSNSNAAQSGQVGGLVGNLAHFGSSGGGGGGSGHSPGNLMGSLGNFAQGGGHGHSSGGSFMGNMGNVGGMMGEASSFFGGRSRDMNSEGYPRDSPAPGIPSPGPPPVSGNRPNLPGTPSFPGSGHQHDFPGSPSFPGSGHQHDFPGNPSFPGSPGQSSYPGSSNTPSFPDSSSSPGYPGASTYPGQGASSFPPEPHRQSSYAPSYGAPPEPNYGEYGAGSYAPPPGPPSGGPAFPGAPGFPDAAGGFPGAQPYGGGPPQFPPGPPGYGGPPPPGPPYGY